MLVQMQNRHAEFSQDCFYLRLFSDNLLPMFCNPRFQTLLLATISSLSHSPVGF